MNAEEIAAIVVSFNGGEKTVQTVRAIAPQVGHVLVVDNGSEAESLAHLSAFDDLPGITVVRLDGNVGIGAALNVGTDRARRLGSRWILTLDQDSRADAGMVAAFRRAVEGHPDREFLVPRILAHGRAGPDGDMEVSYAITSGSLLKLTVIDAVGAFDEAMFIDAIDIDYCLRARARGCKIHRVGDALLHHELGEPHSVRGPFARFYSRHSPLRRYYMYRNFPLLVERHVSRFPLFILKLGMAHLILAGLVLRHDEDPRKSVAAMCDGLRDYWAGRLGRREPD